MRGKEKIRGEPSGKGKNQIRVGRTTKRSLSEKNRKGKQIEKRRGRTTSNGQKDCIRQISSRRGQKLFLSTKEKV